MRLFRCSLLLWCVFLPQLGCDGDGDERWSGHGDAGAGVADNPLAVPGLRPQVDISPLDSGGASPEDLPPCPVFRDVHQAAGLNHVYLNGERGQCLMVETIGAGAGWLDYDADGLWDLYLNQGGDPTGEADESQPGDTLFRNLGDGTFQDVTASAGVAEFRYSQGVAIGDYDNDGFDDIYVTNLGRNTLYHNLGDGSFQDVTEQAGVGGDAWSVSAARCSTWRRFPAPRRFPA